MNNIGSLCYYYGSVCNEPFMLADESYYRKTNGGDPPPVYPFMWYASTFPALAGVFLRTLGSCIRSTSFEHQIRSKIKEIPFNSTSLTIFNANIAAIRGRYCWTSSVPPAWKRLDKIAQIILAQNADIVTLQEVWDVWFANKLIDKLQDKYTHFYFNMGASSGTTCAALFIASKSELQDPQYTPYAKAQLSDKNCTKGIFTCNAGNITLVLTHLQHSNNCAAPSEKEKKARKSEMDTVITIANKIFKDGKTPVILGDFNADEKEWKENKWDETFKGDPNILGEPTWIGEVWAKTTYEPEIYTTNLYDATKKMPSGPLCLDRIVLLNCSKADITTEIIKLSNQDGDKFDENRLSDHHGLFSRVETIK